MSNHPAHLRLVERLLAGDAGAKPGPAGVRTLSAERYTSPDRHQRERAGVFSKAPLIVAAEGELAEPGACLAVDVAGVPLIVVRAGDGSVRALRNACRHRGTELLGGEAPCTKKAFVCPYHGWTYGLDGRLLHVPHEDSFGGAAAERGGLVAAHAAVRHGLVWVALRPFDVAEHLGPIDGELAGLAAAGLVPYRRSTREVRGNWKLIVDAFLDGYHVRHLHRETVYRFFLDARFEAERAGSHIRAVSARRGLLEVDRASLGDVELRQVATPSYYVFPHTLFILHPDYVSVMWAAPLAADRTRFVHLMLIPEAPRTEAAAAHWAKSFTLIDEGVFAREDLAVVESIQRGLAAGADSELLFGALEYGAWWFHDTIDAHL